jgi:hypothetical protein
MANHRLSPTGEAPTHDSYHDSNRPEASQKHRLAEALVDAFRYTGGGVTHFHLVEIE